MDAGPPIVVGISGASGAIYGVRMLEALGAKQIPAHLIISKSAAITLKEEVGLSVEKVRALAQTTYQNTDLGAAVSSGSFRTGGMIIAPCSNSHAVRHSLRHDRQSAQSRRRRYA